MKLLDWFLGLRQVQVQLNGKYAGTIKVPTDSPDTVIQAKAYSLVAEADTTFSLKVLHVRFVDKNTICFTTENGVIPTKNYAKVQLPISDIEERRVLAIDNDPSNNITESGGNYVRCIPVQLNGRFILNLPIEEDMYYYDSNQMLELAKSRLIIKESLIGYDIIKVIYKKPERIGGSINGVLNIITKRSINSSNISYSTPDFSPQFPQNGEGF